MEYLVLARKYRPQAFADLTGQEHVVRTLANAFRTGRVTHALLFCGPRGCGKTSTARIVARALNCEKGPTAEPCGTCTQCREITAGTDVDVQEIDAASNTGVDNVRELRESAKYLPARDRFKIFVVDEVHMLSKAAFNAFLKTLEEPPGHVKFIFATTDPRALPDTILSRCQRHNFRLVPLKQISARMREIARAEDVELDDGALSLVARQAAGSMRDALSVMDQLISSVPSPITEEAAAAALGAMDRGIVADLAGALLSRDAKTLMQAVARVHEGGHDVRRLAEDLAAHLRSLVAVGLDAAALDLPDHEIQALSRQAAGADPAELVRLFDLVSGSLFEISRASQPRHALEVALLKAVYLAPAVSVQTLLARAEDLAQRLGGGGTNAPVRGDGGGASQTPRPLFATTRSEASAPPTRTWSPPSTAPARAPAAPAPAPPPRRGPETAASHMPWERHLSGGTEQAGRQTIGGAAPVPALAASSAATSAATPVQPPSTAPAGAVAAVAAPAAAPQAVTVPIDPAFAARWPGIV